MVVVGLHKVKIAKLRGANRDLVQIATGYSTWLDEGDFDGLIRHGFSLLAL